MKHLEIDAHLQSLEGEGNEVVFLVSGTRTTKTGTLQRYELRLKACRYGVLQLQEQLAAMHARDRSRIARETQRIENERKAIMGTSG